MLKKIVSSKRVQLVAISAAMALVNIAVFGLYKMVCEEGIILDF